MIRMVREIIYDPLPTPAGRGGRAAMLAGIAGWGVLAVAGGLWLLSMIVEEDSSGLSTSLRVAAGWIAGFCVVIYLGGMMCAASGVTQLMNGIPDPGMRSIVLGFTLNGLPMVLIAIAAVYDKYLRAAFE